MPSDYTKLPSKATASPKPFTVNVPEADLANFKTLLKLSPLAHDTYENKQTDGRFGVSMEWMKTAKAEWEKFDWRKTEARINSFPNYILPVKDSHDGQVYDIHFVALFSEREDAIPLALFHGWPGSFLEFLPILDLLKSKYDPSTLPYHIIAPSTPGYAWSSDPPLNRDFDVGDIARLMNSLLVQLGCTNYVAQGGDIGSKISRVLAVAHPECRGVHLNFCHVPPPKNWAETLSPAEEAGRQRCADFDNYGSAYSREHATRPATIGFVMASSPVAQLAWVGEKFLQWTDQDLPLDVVLGDLTLYWLTQTFPTSVYMYRQDINRLEGRVDTGRAGEPDWNITGKPFGFSWFPKELAPTPQSWIETTGDLTWIRHHQSGGHFAALERPETLLADVEEFIKKSFSS